MRKHFWINFFLILCGIVLGSIVAEKTAGINGLGWLSYGMNFGTDAPLSIDLNALHLTFGLNINITISTIIFVVLALLLGKIIIKK